MIILSGKLVFEIILLVCSVIFFIVGNIVLVLFYRNKWLRDIDSIIMLCIIYTMAILFTLFLLNIQYSWVITQ